MVTSVVLECRDSIFSQGEGTVEQGKFDLAFLDQ